MKNPPGYHSHNRAFTLVELLTVVVIALVLSILIFEEIDEVRNSAMGAKNISNHRQIASALLTHAWDHAGNLPYALEKPELSSAPFEGQTISYPRRLVALGYLTDARVFFSPLAGNWYLKSGNLSNSKLHKNDPWNYTNYGANRYGAMPYNQPDNTIAYIPANLQKVAADGNLAKLMLLRDVYNPDFAAFGGGELRFNAANMPPEKRTFGGIVHASFADGHVEGFTVKDLTEKESISNGYSGKAGVSPVFVQTYTR